jgi:hypothetical protein
MKKMKLEMEALRVESFPTAEHAAATPRGTVRANLADDTLAGADPAAKDETVPCTNQTCGNTCGCPTWAPESCYPETYCIG